MNKRDFTRDFQAAFQPEGTWQLINYLPDVADVTEKSSKYRFDIKYLAIGANKKIVPVARRKYNRSIRSRRPRFYYCQTVKFSAGGLAHRPQPGKVRW